jgi:hypothetical protein
MPDCSYARRRHSAHISTSLGAPEPGHPHEHAPVHPADQRLQQEAGELTAVVSQHFMYYNFAGPHITLTEAAGSVRTTLAMAAGVADHVWTLTEIAGLLDSN